MIKSVGCSTDFSGEAFEKVWKLAQERAEVARKEEEGKGIAIKKTAYVAVQTWCPTILLKDPLSRKRPLDVG